MNRREQVSTIQDARFGREDPFVQGEARGIIENDCDGQSGAAERSRTVHVLERLGEHWAVSAALNSGDGPKDSTDCQRGTTESHDAPWTSSCAGAGVSTL